MKNQSRILVLALLTGALVIGCTKNDNNKLTLKQSVDQSALNLNTAMKDITASKAYSIFTVNDGMLKSGTSTDSFRVYIPLEKIKGVFDYQPVEKRDHMGRSVIRFFNMTADNSQMIVRMPLSKVTNPRKLRHYSPEDTLLTNNFSIAVSEYHNNYNSYHDFDYALTSAISVDNVFAGNLDIKSVVNRTEGTHYASQYAFDASYTAKYKYDSGDTTVSSFSITGDDKLLYQEKLLTIKNDTSRFGREHLYILTIGNVEIARNLEKKTVEISVDGILQPNATVTIIDKDEDDEVSVCKKRDVQITFEDGTTTTVSALIGESVADIKTLFDSLHQVYFAAYVVDWIAYDIYYQRN
ncbi:MAG: hypothetical protein WC699_05395 [Bacteroidales bacterium]|jgi:hypothetical protein